MCRHPCVHVISHESIRVYSVYTVCFFTWQGSNKHIVPRELRAHLPHASRHQRPLQCLVCGSSLADLLPARDHSSARRTASAGFAGKQTDKLRVSLNLRGITTINSIFHCLFKQKLSILVTPTVSETVYWMHSRPVEQITNHDLNWKR